MTAMRTRTVLGCLAVALAVAGCGGGGSATRSLSASSIPLVAGARVFAATRSCDRGADAYCALQLVVVAPRYPSSQALLVSEQARLRALDWTDTVGDTPKERSADSPHNRLRLSYALAFDDLESWDMNSLRRRAPIARALAAVTFDRLPALSLMLQAGSS